MTAEKLAKIAIFKTMWEAGASYREIEAATGISVSALGSSRERWGMAPRVRPNSGAKKAIEALSHARKLAHSGATTLEPLPSLTGVIFDAMAEPTDVKMVSHKFMPGHKCAWPLAAGPCGMHCDTPGPYCDDHRKIAYMTPEEAAEQGAGTSWYNPRRSAWT
jgi:hypothetical protein